MGQKGKTPIVEATGARHGLSLISAITSKGHTHAYTALETPGQMANRQRELRNAGEQVLTRAAATSGSLGVTAETTLLEIVEPGKHIYDLIEHEAERWPANLIVIGTHGRRGVRRLLLGSVAEGLIRITTKPVLLVRGE